MQLHNSLCKITQVINITSVIQYSLLGIRSTVTIVIQSLFHDILTKMY